MIKTKFNDIYKTKYPIIQAGMGPYSTERLCIAVAKEGGLGLISTVGMGSFDMQGIGVFEYTAIFGKGSPREKLSRSIDNVLAELKDFPAARFGVNVPVSIEFIETASEIIQTLVEIIKHNPEAKKKIVAVFTSAGDSLPWSVDPGDKRHLGSVPIKKELPDIVWTHVVPSVKAAKRCVKAGVDVVVASGREGGAHCSWKDTSSMVLLPEVIKSIPVPVVAAGGIADGLSIAAALTMGAIGVQIGTRFIATQEAEFEQQWKDLLVSSTEEDSMVARGFFGPMRFIKNKRALELVEATIKGAPKLYKGIPCASTQEILDLEISGLHNLWSGKIDSAPVLGGQSAGRIHSIPTVAKLISDMITEAEKSLRNASKIIE